MLALALHSLAQVPYERILKSAAQPENWLTYSGNYQAHRYSTLDQIARANVHHFATSDEAAAAIGDLIRPGDLVLVKGSRGVRTDRVVDSLKAHRAERG